MEENKKNKIIFNILAVICIVMFCFAVTPITLQNDTYYTIAIGKHITENGIDMMDPFSWHENLPYTYPHWLYDVAIYGVYKFFGFTGIYISTIILASILGITMYFTNNKITKNQLVSFILTVGAMYALKGFIAARAQLVTFILFTLELCFIEMFMQSKKKRYLIGLVLIALLIANLHVAVWPFFFVIFLPYIAEYIIAYIRDKHLIHKIYVGDIKSKIRKLEKSNKKDKEEKIIELKDKMNNAIDKFDKFKKKQQEVSENPYRIKIEKNDSVKWLIIVMIICIFTGLITPLGDAPYTYLVKTMQGNTTQSISEHLPIVLGNKTVELFTIVLFLVILIFTDTKIKLRDLFMVAGLTYLTLKSQRQFSMLVIFGVYVLNKLISDIFEKYDKQGTENFIKIMTTWIGRILTILFFIAISWFIFKDKADNKIVDERSYPVQAAQYIKENLDLENIKLYNEYNYGSYLLFEGIPVFIDSRADLYAPEFNNQDKDIFSDFITIVNINKYYEEMFDKYEFTHLILQKNAKLNIFLSRDDNYKELYSDDYFVVYERNTNKTITD